MTDRQILDEETKNLHASLEQAGKQGDKVVRFPIKKEMIDAFLEANKKVQDNREDIPTAEKDKFGNMLGNVFGVIEDAIEGVDDWWNKPVRDMADGTPQTRGQKWSRRLSKGFDATVDFASDAIQTIAKDFENDSIEEVIIDLPLLLGKQVLQGMDWLNEWIKGWDLNPKDKANEKMPEKGDVTKNLSKVDNDNQVTQNIPKQRGMGNGGNTENIPKPQGMENKGNTRNIPSPQGNKSVSIPRLPTQETQNLLVAKLWDRKSR